MSLQNFSLVFFLVLSLALNAPAQTKATEDVSTNQKLEDLASPQVLKLIELLESDSFDDREDATQKLILEGPKVKPVIEFVSKESDEEIRYRCKQILTKIADNQHVLQQAAFLKGDVEQLVRNKSSWKRLEKMIGNSEKTRKMFLQMQNEDEGLLTLYEKNPNQCSSRIIELYNENNQLKRFTGKGLPAGAHAAVIFVASDDKIDLDSKAASYTYSLCYSSKNTELADDELFLSLLGKLCIRKTATSAQLYQYARLSKYFKLKEAREIALKMVSEKSASGSYRAVSLIDLGTELGTREDVPVIEKLINDNTLLYKSTSKTRPKGTFMLGDTALAMAIKLSGEKTEDYNFTNYYKDRKTATTLNYRHFGFLNDQERAAARKKWFSRKDGKPNQSGEEKPDPEQKPAPKPKVGSKPKAAAEPKAPVQIQVEAIQR